MNVKDTGTGEYFGAKEPYLKISDNADIARQRFEALRMEYTHIKHLDHVSGSGHTDAHHNLLIYRASHI